MRVAAPRRMSTPRPFMELVRLLRMVVARLVAWSAMPWRSKRTSPTSMPSILRWSAFFMSRTRPEAARSALEGTQPRFTQVPPMSPPSMMAVFIGALHSVERGAVAADAGADDDDKIVVVVVRGDVHGERAGRGRGGAAAGEGGARSSFRACG